MRPRIATEIVVWAAALCLAFTGCKKTPFAQEHALAEARNPRWLSIELDTTDKRRQYRESESIGVITRYSSDVPYQYKIDIAEQWSVAVQTDMLHIDDGQNMYLKPGIACCSSRLIGLNREPYLVHPIVRFRLKPGAYEMYLTTRRVFAWDARNNGTHASSMQTASNLLKLRVVPDPGWQEREVADILPRLNAGPLACGQLSALDVPAATAEKLKNIENATTCGYEVRFHSSEFQSALPAMEKIIRSPDYGVTYADVSRIAEMRTWLAHPEARQVRSWAFTSLNEGGWTLAIEEEKRLLQEVCLLLPDKSPKVRAITQKTIRESLARKEFQGMKCGHVRAGGMPNPQAGIR